MDAFDITWPGSSDRITVSAVTARDVDARNDASEYLAAHMGPGYWPAAQHIAGGPFLSVDQRVKWSARIGDVFNAGGVLLVARHTSSNGGVIAVAAAEPVPGQPYSREVVQTKGGYEAATVDDVMLTALKRECALVNLPLARPRTVWEVV